MSKAFLMMLLVIISSSVMAEWVEIGISENFIVYVDPATIRKSGNMVRIWSLHDYKTTQGSISYMSSTLEREHDCIEKRGQQLFLAFYSKNMGRGATIWKDTELRNWRQVTSDTVKETVWKYACGKG
jgi:hypothetical protein